MSTILGFIKKNSLLIILLLLMVVLGVFKFLKPRPKDQTENANAVLDDTGLSVSKKEELKDKAMQLAHHLGTAYPWYDPRSLTENDQEVFDIMQTLSESDFVHVSQVYFLVYAKGRTLSVDLAKLLDDDLYKELNVK